MNINEILTDEEIEECIDGSTSIDNIRSIITLTQVENLIDEESFADLFADQISSFIDEVPLSEEWETCNDINWDWGYSIAENINSLIVRKWTQ